MSETGKAVFLTYASPAFVQTTAWHARRGGGAAYLRSTTRHAGVEAWFDQSELRVGDAWDVNV